MNYDEAKQALDKTGISSTSQHVFLLEAESRNGFSWQPHTITMALISTKEKMMDVYSEMKTNGMVNENALNTLGLIDNNDLNVYLFSMIGEPEQRHVTLEYYLRQSPAQ